MKNQNTDHIIIMSDDDDPSSLYCTKCWAIRPISLPIEVKHMAVIQKIFSKDHKRCGGNNCYGCEHLEWVDGDEGAPSGYCCDKRQADLYDTEAENKLLKNLDSHEYRRRQKRCFEKKVRP